MAAAEGIRGPDDLDDEGRAAVERLLRRLADDEFVLAERHTEWQVRSPTLESDLALANVAQDELGHARLWYDLLMDFGYDEPDLIWERGHEGWRHCTLVELPFQSGDWADAIVRGYLYDVAEGLRLDALAGSSYARIADRVEKIRGEETYHLEHARSWLERLAEQDDGRTRVQAAVDRLFPHALTIFEPGDDERDARVDDLGLRTRSLSAMRQDWLDAVVPYLHSLGIETPVDGPREVTDDLLPARPGRDGAHTDDWPELYDEFTRTYRELGRDRADRIMEDPDDVE